MPIEIKTVYIICLDGQMSHISKCQ